MTNELVELLQVLSHIAGEVVSVIFILLARKEPVLCHYAQDIPGGWVKYAPILGRVQGYEIR